VETWVRKVRVNGLEEGGVVIVNEPMVILMTLVKSFTAKPVNVVLVVVAIVELVFAKAAV
jgi:hypothetical protein